MQTNDGKWLITGVAGFIGSHILERLLGAGQQVIGVDNFLTSDGSNLVAVEAAVGPAAWSRFRFLEADAVNLSAHLQAIGEVDYAIHQAALCSVPESMADPRRYYTNNLLSTIELLEALRSGWCRRLVFASSSAVYGEGSAEANREGHPLSPLSPYGESKRMGELLAAQYSANNPVEWVGLRYFNVFGRRQRFAGPYSSVIQVWLNAVQAGTPCVICGNGSATRDFVPVERVVDFNLLAAAALPPESVNRVYNVASGQARNMAEVFDLFRAVVEARLGRRIPDPVKVPARNGDIQRSVASVAEAGRNFPALAPCVFRTELEALVAASL